MTKLSETVFLYSLNASFALYIIVLLGVGGYAPQYLESLKSFLRIYIGLLLFITYNPYTYKQKQFGEFDRQLVFSSGIFLLLECKENHERSKDHAQNSQSAVTRSENS